MIARTVADLPQPVSPTTPTVSPVPTENETPLTACTVRRRLRNCTCRSRTSSSGPEPPSGEPAAPALGVAVPVNPRPSR